jgi:bile acid:Na+ symporter, BASS family
MDLLRAFGQQAAFINAEVIPWVLRLVMVGMGLTLTLADFRRVVKYPTAVTIGVLAQIIGVPLIAYGAVLVLNPPPAIAIGLMILAACVSGVTSNAYSFAAGADVPLCVTISAVTSVVTVFTIPYLINFALQAFADPGQMTALPVLGMLRDLVNFTLVPLVIGMLVRARFTAVARKLEEPLRKAVLYLMAGVLVLGAASSYQQIIDYIAVAGVLVVVVNVLTMAFGYALARLFRLPTPQVVTIVFEVGIQNLALALAITFRMMNRPDLAVAALLYAVVMPATALTFVSIARTWIAREAASGPVVGSRT